MKLSQNTTSSLSVCVSPIFFIVMILCKIWMRVTWYTNFFLAVYAKRCWVFFLPSFFFFFLNNDFVFPLFVVFFFFLLSTPVFSIFMLAHLYQRGHLAQAPSSTHESTIFLCAIQRVCSGKINPVRNFNFLSRWMDVNLVPIPTISSHVKMNIDDTHR